MGEVVWLRGLYLWRVLREATLWFAGALFQIVEKPRLDRFRDFYFTEGFSAQLCCALVGVEKRDARGAIVEMFVKFLCRLRVKVSVQIIV